MFQKFFDWVAFHFGKNADAEREQWEKIDNRTSRSAELVKELKKEEDENGE